MKARIILHKNFGINQPCYQVVTWLVTTHKQSSKKAVSGISLISVSFKLSTLRTKPSAHGYLIVVYAAWLQQTSGASVLHHWWLFKHPSEICQLFSEGISIKLHICCLRSAVLLKWSCDLCMSVKCREKIATDPSRIQWHKDHGVCTVLYLNTQLCKNMNKMVSGAFSMSNLVMIFSNLKLQLYLKESCLLNILIKDLQTLGFSFK